MADKLKSNKKPRSVIALLMVIGIAAIIVANIIVWKNYFAEQSIVDDLKNEIIGVNQQIAQAEQPPTGLESKLQQAEDDLAAVLQVFPDDIDRTDVVDFILDIAEACDVKVVPLAFTGWGTSKVSQSYVILKYRGTVTGKLIDATKFITMLRNGDFPTIVITECSIERTTALGSIVPDSDLEVSIELVIELYATSVQATKDSFS